MVAADEVKAGGRIPASRDLVEIGGAYRPVVRACALRQREPGRGRNDLCAEPAVTGVPAAGAAARQGEGLAGGRQRDVDGLVDRGDVDRGVDGVAVEGVDLAPRRTGLPRLRAAGPAGTAWTGRSPAR